jgi:hypothetical protein
MARIKKPLRERRFIVFIDESGLSEPQDAELVGPRQSLCSIALTNLPSFV